MYRKYQNILAYSALNILVILIIFVIYNFPISLSNLSIPINYWADSKEVLAKLLDFLHHDKTELLYAPFGFQDISYQSLVYKIADIVTSPLDQLILHFLSIFTQDPAIIANLFYLLTFPLVATAFIFCAKNLKISYLSIIPFAVLYTFLYYHFYRHIGHLACSAYMLVPFYVLFLIWLQDQKPLFFKQTENGYKLDIFNKKAYLIFFVILILSPVMEYYLLFFYLLIPFAFLSGIHKKSIPFHALSILILIILGFISYGKKHVPDYLFSLVNQQAYEQQIADYKNIESYHPLSSWGDAERYGLKISQLLMPVDKHRIDFLAKGKERYNSTNIVNENTSSSLGMICSFGFLFLLGVAFAFNLPGSMHRSLAVLNLGSLLIGTVGGLGALLPIILQCFFKFEHRIADVRAFNRISVVIACVSFLCLAILLHKLICLIDRKISGKKLKACLAITLCALIITIGLLDQSPLDQDNYFIDYNARQKEIAEEYKNDHQFVKRIEHLVGDRARIFQLPAQLHHFARSDISAQKFHYADCYTGYIHSRSLQWTFGADRWSVQAEWYLKAANLPLKKMIRRLSLFDFSGKTRIKGHP